MKVAILTPAPEELAYKAFWPEWFANLEAGLEAHGVKAEPRCWTEEIGRFDAVLPMIAWGYHKRAADWFALLDRFEADGQRMINSVTTLRWNSDKAYLAELGAKGVPTVPTISVEALTEADIERARQTFGAETIIAKPRISAGSHQTLKLAPGDPLDGGPEGPALIQPFLPEVSGEGEISLLHFDGVFSHAVAKVAAEGDFRVQPQFGSTIAQVEPWEGALETAQAVLAAVPPLTYCRVDLLRGLDGSLQLMELEAIEPDLFLQYAPEGAMRFGAAVKRALSSS